jgi:hypothetical protein
VLTGYQSVTVRQHAGRNAAERPWHAPQVNQRGSRADYEAMSRVVTLHRLRPSLI